MCATLNTMQSKIYKKLLNKRKSSILTSPRRLERFSFSEVETVQHNIYYSRTGKYCQQTLELPKERKMAEPLNHLKCFRN